MDREQEVGAVSDDEEPIDYYEDSPDGDDIEATNQAASEFMAQARPDVPTIDDPPEGTVELLWGIEVDRSRYRTAIVRELNGADEEALARVNRNASNYNVMIQDTHLRRAVMQVGPIFVEKEPDTLAELLLCDRERLFKEILLISYGRIREYENVPCQRCSAGIDITIDLDGVIEVSNDREFDTDTFIVDLHGKQALFHYPRGGDQIAVFQDVKRPLSTPEANTQFIVHCVETVDGKAVPNPSEWALNLSVSDRRKIVKALLDMPVLTFKEDEVPCHNCGEKMPVAIGWADLLPG